MQNPDLQLSTKENNPLQSLDEWEDDVLERYPDPELINSNKSKQAFRNYDTPARDTVKEFYRLNHKYQTYDFVQEKKNDFLQFNKKEMPVWEAFDFLNQLVDDSDPDTDLDQLKHLLLLRHSLPKHQLKMDHQELLFPGHSFLLATAIPCDIFQYQRLYNSYIFFLQTILVACYWLLVS